MDASTGRLSDEYRLAPGASDKIFAAILGVEGEPVLTPTRVIPMYAEPGRNYRRISRAIAAAAILILLAGSATWWLARRHATTTENSQVPSPL